MNKMFKRYMAVTLSFLMVTMCVGRSSAMLAPTSAAVATASIQRNADMRTVQTFLEQKQVRDRLVSFGMSDDEIQSRLKICPTPICIRLPRTSTKNIRLPMAAA